MNTRTPVFHFGLATLAMCAFVLSLALSAQPTQAQFATVRGRVADGADAQPLPGAAIVLQSEAGE